MIAFSDSFDFRILELEATDLNLYRKIQDTIKDIHPDTLMVYGLQEVKNIAEFLAATNNQRDKFRQEFKFPVILWVRDWAIAQFEELALDFHNWAVTVSLFCLRR